MNWYRQVGLVALAWRSAAQLALRGSVWAPVMLVSIVEAAGLLLLLFFHHPALVSFAGPWVEVLGGEAATHYPEHLYALPSMFRRVDLGITLLIAPMAIGVATLRFAEGFGRAPRAGAWRTGLRAAPTLVLLALLLWGLREGTAALFGLIPKKVLAKGIIVEFGLSVIQYLIVVVIQTLLAYGAAWVVLRGHSWIAAIRDSIRMALADPLGTFLLVAVPAGLLFPFWFVLEKMDLSDSDRGPEIVAVILGIWLLVRLVLTFLRVGSITRLFVWKLETGR